ncbi:MAG: radical SAM protein [Candidatus Micrarchaeota archaeon]
MKIKSLLKNELSLKYFEPMFQLYVDMRDVATDMEAAFNYHVLNNRSVRLETPFPQRMGIAPTNHCNANCIFCAYRKLKDTDRYNHMDLKEFEKAVDDFAANGGKEIGLTPTVGEVLLDPTIFEKIKYAKSRGLRVDTVSNGLLLAPNGNYGKLLESGLDLLDISIGDILPAIDSKIYGIPQSASEFKIDGILKLLDERKKNGSKMKVVLAFRSSRSEWEVLNDLKKSKLGEHYRDKSFEITFLRRYDNWGGRIGAEELAGMQKMRRGAKFKKYPCAGLYNIGVLANGDIRLCGCRAKDTLFDDLVIGNMRDTKLKDAWESKDREKIIKEFSHGRYPQVCIECSAYTPKIR